MPQALLSISILRSGLSPALPVFASKSIATCTGLKLTCSQRNCSTLVSFATISVGSLLLINYRRFTNSSPLRAFTKSKPWSSLWKISLTFITAKVCMMTRVTMRSMQRSLSRMSFGCSQMYLRRWHVVTTSVMRKTMGTFRIRNKTLKNCQRMLVSIHKRVFTNLQS